MIAKNVKNSCHISKNIVSSVSVVGKVFLLANICYLFLINGSSAQEVIADNFILERIHGNCENCGYEYVIRELRFVDTGNGWASANLYPKVGGASGTAAMLRTADGGRSWRMLEFTARPNPEELIPFCFINNKQGWIAWDDAEEILFVTANGGRNWRTLKSESSFSRKHIKFFDDRSGYAVEYQAWDGLFFAKTEDGGKSWSRKRLQTDSVRHMYFADHRIGWLFGGAYPLSILKTVDAGESWTEINIPFHHRSGYDLIHKYFLTDNGDIWLIIWHHGDHDGSYLLRTSDGGISWKQHPDLSFQGEGKYLDDVKFLPEKTGFAFYTEEKTGKAYMLHTQDSGENWQKFPLKEGVNTCQIFQGGLICSAGLNLLKIRPAGRK